MTLADDRITDASIFSNTDDFGKVAIYTPFGGSAVSIDVRFVESRRLPSIDPYNGESSEITPYAKAKTTDVPNAAHKDTLEIDSITYEVLRTELINDGIRTKLYLNPIP